jgi:endonuclease-8
MPEGDTIFRTARALGRALTGKPITVFRSTYPLLTRFNDDTPLAGQVVESVESRGKWLLIHFSGGGTLATHMLMSGSWHIYRPGERWQLSRQHMRIVIENSDYLAIGFHVPVARMHTAQSLARDPKIPPPALDVLSLEFDASAAAHRILAHGNEEIGDVLLHQEVLAGVGNVFKSEVCFVSGINPFCKVAALTAEQIAGLVATSRKLVAANVLEDSGNSIVTAAENAALRTNPIQARVCGSMAEKANPAAVAANRFVAASRASTRGSPIGARDASSCPTEPRSMAEKASISLSPYC